MSLAPYVQIVARGKGRGRSMSFAEAVDAMAIILNGEAEPEALGAVLMVMRLRGETAEEIAGFTVALRNHVKNILPKADLDWPSYAAGRTRGSPLFILAARLVSQAGYSVSMHGWNSHQQASASVRDALIWAGPTFRYTAIEDLCPEAFALLKLRDTFGLRSCINTVLRMWNPSRASVTVQGVFHPSYRGLQAEAAQIIDENDLVVIKGGGGEFERNPAKGVAIYGWKAGQFLDQSAPALTPEKRKLHDVNEPIDLGAVWHGQNEDPFAKATVTGTAAIALWSLNATNALSDAQSMAEALWHSRHNPESLSA